MNQWFPSVHAREKTQSPTQFQYKDRKDPPCKSPERLSKCIAINIRKNYHPLRLKRQAIEGILSRSWYLVVQSSSGTSLCFEQVV
jgi:hypothetical protein